jgi:hypothetical protein
MALEDYRGNEMRNRVTDIFASASDLSNLAMYLECLVDSGQANGDFPALKMRFNVSPDYEAAAGEPSLTNTSFGMSEYRMNDSMHTTYTESDFADILGRVDSEIYETLGEFNSDLERSLQGISRDLDSRRVKALPSQALKDRIIKNERNAIKLRQHSLLSDMKKFYRDRREFIRTKKNSTMNSSLASISEDCSFMDMAELQDIENTITEVVQKSERLIKDIQQFSG